MTGTYGQLDVRSLRNRSVGEVAKGDVVTVDLEAQTFDTTTIAGTLEAVGIVQDARIARGRPGRILVSGYAELVNTGGREMSRGTFGRTHEVARQAAPAGRTRTAAAFCEFLTDGRAPAAMVIPLDLRLVPEKPIDPREAARLERAAQWRAQCRELAEPHARKALAELERYLATGEPHALVTARQSTERAHLTATQTRGQAAR